MPICIAFKKDGCQCTNNAIERRGDGSRCGMHYNSLLKCGPNQTERNELEYRQKKEISDFTKAFLDNLGVDHVRELNNESFRRHHVQHEQLRLRHRVEQNILLTRQQDDIDITGINPDAEAIRRRRAALLARVDALAARRQQQHRFDNIRIHILRPDHQEQNIPIEIHPLPQQERNLENIVNDRQNVHTTEVVRQTKEIVERICRIPVPEEYRWHPINSSRTPFEIGLECKLSQSAAWQMISQYAQDTAIYDIEPGIYGKVLDSMWQYVKNSSEKESLCAIIKSELEDNVGMCAQGNLSRICNVLAGVMEGVGSQESLSERLGRLFGPLLEIDSQEERTQQGLNILKENNVPKDEWVNWLDGLVY